MWSKYVTRRLAVQVAQAWNFGWGGAMDKVYGVSVKNTLVFRDAKKTDYYVDKEEHENYVRGLYKLLEDHTFLRSFHHDAQDVLESILVKTQERLTGELSTYTHEKLLSLYSDFVLPNQTQFYVRMWAVFNIGEPLANTVEKQLRKCLTDEREITKNLLILSTPLQPNDVLNERVDLCEIALDRQTLSQEALTKRIQKHTEQFRHIPMFDFDHEPYSEDYFKQTLQSIDNPKEELKKIHAQFLEHTKEFETALAAIRPDPNFELLLQFLKENVFLRDYRDMIRQKLNLELRRFYSAVAEKLELTLEEVAILTNDEIKIHLQKKVKFSREEIDKRSKAYLLIQRGDDSAILSGEEALTQAQKEKGVSTLSHTELKEVSGIVGARGKASGRIKIIYTNKDLHKIETGDVLVAPMTRQDFVPAMRKAAAIVTDEGSVTAHAAIIARELGKPCIVATHVATQVFKDGDMVEVDAGKGIVRIISK